MAKTPTPPPAAMPAVLIDFPERLERLDCPDLYASHWVDVVTNQPDLHLDGLSVPEALVQAIRAWSFQTKDGQPAPITGDALSGLPPDLQNWMRDQFIERRRRPLAARLPSSPTPMTSSGPPPQAITEAS